MTVLGLNLLSNALYDGGKQVIELIDRPEEPAAAADPEESLRRLKRLRDEGLITETIYADAVREVVRGITQPVRDDGSRYRR
jgi:hypothetical protein